MRYMIVFASVMMLVTFAVLAQQEPVTQEDGPAETDSVSETDSTSAEDAVQEPKGDTIILEDGRRIENVQVLRRTATDYEIEIVAGAAPMALPRAVVKSVEWDDHDPLGLNIGEITAREPVAETPPSEASLAEGIARDASGNAEILPGLKVPAELVGKLRKDITAQVRGFSGKDLFEVLNVIRQTAELQIAADQPLREMASKAGGLKVKVTLEDDATVNVVQFLEIHLLKQPEMKRVGIIYKPDRVLVTTKEAVMKMREQEEQESESSSGQGS